MLPWRPQYTQPGVDRRTSGGVNSLRHALTLLALASAVALPNGVSAAGDDAELKEYDRLEAEIEQHARAAAQLHNMGRIDAANDKLKEAEASFRAAKALRPTDPQAFATFATAMLNSQRFEEAVKNWNKAASLMPAGHAQDWMKGRSRWSQYGKVSTKRDKVYSKGQGNLTKALSLLAKQIKVYPEFPTLHHDKATVLAMLASAPERAAVADSGADGSAEGGSSDVEEALRELDLAQRKGFEAWRAGLRQDGGACCESCGGLIQDWPQHVRGRWSFWEATRGGLMAVDWLSPEDATATAPSPISYGNSKQWLDRGAFMARFEQVAIAGDDALILDEASCNIFLHNSGVWTSPAQNLQLLEIWTGPAHPQIEMGPYFQWHDHHRGKFEDAGKVQKPQKVGKLASIAQFAASSYFHFMTEVLGRLQILRQAKVFDDKEVKLLAPQGAAGRGGFVEAALNTLALDLIDAKRVIWLRSGGPPDVRLRAEVLFFADWPLPAPLGADGSHCPTPRSTLRRVREGLLGGLAAASSNAGVGRAVFVSRAGADMRGRFTEESSLRATFREAVKEASPPLVFEEFSGGLALTKQIALFRQARAVLGVHGGALTNIIFCEPDAVVIEVGFDSPFAGHYRHLAAALGMRLIKVPLRADERGIGAREIALVDLDTALATVRSAIDLAAPASGHSTEEL